MVTNLPTSRRKSSRWHGLGPVGVVDQPGLGGARAEVEQTLQLQLDAAHVVSKRVEVEQVPLVAAPGGITHHPGRTAGEWERLVTRQLEAAQEQLADEVTHVERVGGGIEPHVERHRSLREAGRQRGPISGVVDESTRGEVVEKVHTRTMLPGGTSDHSTVSTHPRALRGRH